MLTLHRCCALIICFSFPLFPQHKVDSRHLYERIFAVVPMTGVGTYADPKRPMFAPTPAQMTPGDRTGIIAWHYEASDDGKWALVELVFSKRSELTPVMSALSALPTARSFQKGKDSGDSIERVMQTFKKGFSLDQFMMRVAQ